MSGATSPARLFWQDFSESWLALLGLALVLIIVAAALGAPWITPQDPYDQANLALLDARLAPGSIGTGGYVHWLGTDAAGRDITSAILYGLRTSIFVAAAAGGVALVAGTLVGLFAAWRGGMLEQLLMRLVDLQLSLPAILLALVLVAALGQGTWQVVAALVTAQYAYFARTAHGAASTERGRDYMDAARVLALPPTRQILRHLLPNVLPPLIVVATVQVANAIAIEATLSFLGVGMPVTEPSLGTLISNGFQYMLSGRYWISVYPGLALLLLIIGINLVGDQLRDVMNPRLRK
jgi:peptide/nickel transport system permease protein